MEKWNLMNHDELYNHLEKLTSKYEKFQQCPDDGERYGKGICGKGNERSFWN
jgi:transcriptional regulator